MLQLRGCSRRAMECALFAVVWGSAHVQAQERLSVKIESEPPGAKVFVDTTAGEPVGVTPLQVRLPRGNHTLYFELDGYQDKRIYAEITPETGLIQAQLRPLAILVVSGRDETAAAAVARIDGQRVGEVPLEVKVSPGRHLLELRKPGFLPFDEWIEAQPGERLSIPVVLQPAEAETGSILVTSDVAGAPVVLDGEVRGVTPTVINDVHVGKHRITIKLRDQPYSAEVDVAAGQRVAINPTLTAARQGERKRLIVEASIGGAEVIIDGRSYGDAPVVVRDLTSRRYDVEVRAEGYAPYDAMCDLSESDSCRIEADMQPIGSPLRVEANVAGARLRIDNQPVGLLPYEGHLAAGTHQLQISAPGYQDYFQKITLKTSTIPRLVFANLETTAATRRDDERARRQEDKLRRYGATSYSAMPLPVDQSTVDISTGWPFLAELRLNVGLLEFLEIGISGRTFGRLTEFEGRTKAGIRLGKQFALAGQVRFGGGVGPQETVTSPETGEDEDHPINTWFAAVEALGSLDFDHQGAFTLWLGLDAYTDRYDFSGEDKEALITPKPSRQEQMRLRLGGALELVLDRRWNVWALLEGVLLSPEADRRIFGDIYGFGIDDTELYFRLGATYKF